AASLLDDPGERRVMQVANAGKQVVLHLEVEATQIPAEQRVRGGEVHRGRNLMLRPVGLDAAAAEELGLSHAVRELEDGGEHVAQGEDAETPEQQQRPRRVE